MKNIIALFCASVLMLGAYSCNSNPLLSVPLEDEKDATPGRRDYAWISDTLKIPFTTLYGMWGDAVDNVWAVGPGGGLDKTIWRYDGSKWSTDGISRNIAPECIFGFGKNDIWTGGEFGSLWHFDGNTWTKMYQVSIVGYEQIFITNIYGDDPKDIYAVGVAYKDNAEKGFIFHYDGYLWTKVYMASYRSQFLKISRGKSESDKYYIFWAVLGNIDTCSIAEFDGKTLKQIRNTEWNNNKTNNFYCFNNKMYFIIDCGVYKYWYGKFINILKVSDDGNFSKIILLRNSKDIILLMNDGVAHYNGNNTEYLFRNTIGSKISLRGGVILENDVFILEYSNLGFNIIHHGTLRK
jgi:hypothetical protein